MTYLEILKLSGYDFIQIGNSIAIHDDLGTKQNALATVKKLAKDVFIAAGITPVFMVRYWSRKKMVFTPYRYNNGTIADEPHQYPFNLSDNSTRRYTQISSNQHF